MITGGQYSSKRDKYRDEIYKLDTETNSWELVGRMKTGRRYHAVSVINYRDVEEYCGWGGEWWKIELIL